MLVWFCSVCSLACFVPFRELFEVLFRQNTLISWYKNIVILRFLILLFTVLTFFSYSYQLLVLFSDCYQPPMLLILWWLFIVVPPFIVTYISIDMLLNFLLVFIVMYFLSSSQYSNLFSFFFSIFSIAYSFI